MVDLFVSDAGLLLNFSDEVRLVSRDGKTIQSVKAPREVTAAAFDGKLRLVVADKGQICMTYQPKPHAAHERKPDDADASTHG